ncbi:MAG: class B sortase [Acetatifactor sp.]
MGKDHGNNKTKYRILTFVCALVCLCCVVWLAAYLIGQRSAQAEVEDLRDVYISGGDGSAENTSGNNGVSDGSGETAEPSAEPEIDLSAYGVTDRLVDIAGLQEEVNRDIYAWITVPGTVIDYPVLQHPEEMDYYLDYNLDGTKGYPGCIYTQRMNSKDWTDPNTVLYGHNMRDGTMFADLHKFEDRGFFDENRYIHIYTEDDRVLVYEIFAAYAGGNEHQLLMYPIYTEDGFQSYLDGIFEHTGWGCNFLEDRELNAEDRIITLSTCINGQADRRYLIQGVLVAEKNSD